MKRELSKEETKKLKSICNIIKKKMGNNKDKGIVYIPYIIGEPESTDINGEVVWYRNKMKNLLLKIKRLFYKSKNLKNAEKYLNKKVNSSFYGVIKIDDGKQTY